MPQVTVGDFKQNDGVSSDRYPLNTVIDGNHFHEIGVTGKQTAALFSGNAVRDGSRCNVLQVPYVTALLWLLSHLVPHTIRQ
jgi:hypothetical protein